jgi:hypothetical protein
MIRTEDENFVYTFESRQSETGETLWQCDVCRHGDVVSLVTSISVTSGMAAHDEARRALDRLKAA